MNKMVLPKWRSSGVSLLETMVLIVILMIALTVSANLLSVGFGVSRKNQEVFVATYLTQECLELARNLRDSSKKQRMRWDCAFYDEFSDSFNNEFFVKSVAPTSDLNGLSVDCKKDFGVLVELYDSVAPQKIEFDDEMTTDAGGGLSPKDLNQRVGGFSRRMITRREDVSEEGLSPEDLNQRLKEVENQILITCETSWEGGEESVRISEVLTNWRN